MRDAKLSQVETLQLALDAIHSSTPFLEQQHMVEIRVDVAKRWAGVLAWIDERKEAMYARRR